MEIHHTQMWSFHTFHHGHLNLLIVFKGSWIYSLHIDIESSSTAGILERRKADRQESDFRYSNRSHWALTAPSLPLFLFRYVNQNNKNEIIHISLIKAKMFFQKPSETPYCILMLWTRLQLTSVWSQSCNKSFYSIDDNFLPNIVRKKNPT